MSDLYRIAFDQLKDPVFIHLIDGKIIGVNEAASLLTGFSRDELLNMGLKDIELPGAADLSPEKMREIENGGAVFERIVLTRSGKQVPMEISVTPIEVDGQKAMIGIGRDISERKRLEKEIVDSRNRLNTIFDSVQVGVLLVERDTHRIVDINPAGEELFGAPKSEIVGSICHNFICPAEFGKCPVTDLCQKVDRSERRMVKKDGSFLPITKSVVEISLGEKRYLLESFIDISNIKAAEKALQDSEEKYRQLSSRVKDIAFRFAFQPTMGFDYLSPIVKDILGYTNMDLDDLMMELPELVHPEDLISLADWLETSTKEKRYDRPIIIRIMKQDGEYACFDIRYIPVLNEKDELIALEGVGRDVTHEKKIEEDLRYRIKFDDLITELSTQFINLKVEDIDVGISNAMEKIAQFIHADRAFIYKLTDGGTKLRRTHQWEDPGNDTGKWPEGIMYSSSWSFLRDMLLKGETVMVSDVETLPKNAAIERESLMSIGVRSIVLAPIRVGGVPCGFIGCDWLREKQYLGPSTQMIFKICAEMITNVIERQNKDRELTREKEHLSITLRSIADGVIATDLEGKIVLMNQAAEEITAWNQDDAKGRPLDTVFVTYDEKTHERIPNPALDSIGSGFTISRVRCSSLLSKGGKDTLVDESAAPILDKDGRPIGAVIVFRDVTEVRKMEERIIASQKLEAVGTLAGGIAHDFNNALSAIMGNIEMAQMGTDLPDNAYLKLDEAGKACLRARALTQQLLTLSRGGAPVKKASSLIELLEDTMSLAMAGSNIRVEYHLQKGISLVDIDEGQIHQVIKNIAINSREAMPHGGTMVVSAENSHLDQGNEEELPEGEYVRLMITDSGIGIPEDLLPKIFDPYFTTKENGNGLGLFIAFSVIEKHEGSINISSKQGAGTTITIYLRASLDPRLTESKVKGTTGPGRVLVMDDEEGILEVDEGFLTHLGYEVECARDGEEAILLYRRAIDSGRPFDLVIMDLTVPGKMGGKEAIGWLKKIDPAVRAIVSSGYSDDPVMADHSAYGFIGTLPKPFQFEELAAALSQVMPSGRKVAGNGMKTVQVASSSVRGGDEKQSS